MSRNNMKSISILRRLASIIYDSLLVFAILIIMSIPFYSFNVEGNNILKLTMQVYFYLVTQYFFVWFWVNSQGTLGMKTWKIKIICEDGNKISYKKAVIRINSAIFSILYLEERCREVVLVCIPGRTASRGRPFKYPAEGCIP